MSKQTYKDQRQKAKTKYKKQRQKIFSPISLQPLYQIKLNLEQFVFNTIQQKHTIMDKRLRKEKRYLKALTLAIDSFKNLDWPADEAIDEAKMDYKYFHKSWSAPDLEKLEQDLINEFYDILKTKYEGRVKRNEMSLFEVEEEFAYHDNCIGLITRLMELLAAWEKLYEPKVIPGNELARLADDKQNVHTGAVNKQTRVATEIIINTTIPNGQKTLDEILTSWLFDLKIGSDMSLVYKDMLSWANKDLVVQKGDYLYRRMLRGLWAKIKTYDTETRLELVKRLWEETSEAVGLCAQGHISRLANVLVGFDDNFVSQQTIHDALAYINRLEIPVHIKIEKAIVVMDEMSLPQTERQAWLDAFD